jgi:hypothetical protein
MDVITCRSHNGFTDLPRWAARVSDGLTDGFSVAGLIRPRNREPYDRTREPGCPSNGTAERHHRLWACLLHVPPRQPQ